MKKLLLFLVMSFVFALHGYAAEKDFVITVSNNGTVQGGTTTLSGLSNGDALTGKSFSDGEITVQFVGEVKYYSGAIRVYKGNTIVITRKSGNLSTVSIDPSGSGYNLSNCSASNGSISGNKWQNHSATTVTLTGGSTQCRFTKMTVKYDDNSSETPVGKDPDLYWTDYSGYPYTRITSYKAELGNEVYLYVASGDNSFPSNATFTYSSSDADVATIDADGVVTLKSEGETTIRANYAGDATFKAASTQYVLTVIASKKCAAPVIAPGEGTYSVGQEITFTSSTPGAKISYVINDDVKENLENGCSYTFEVAGKYEVTAYATADGCEDSDWITVVYDIEDAAPAQPVFTPAAGSYKRGTEITITSAGATQLAYQFSDQDKSTVIDGNTVRFTLTDDVVVAAMGKNDVGMSDRAQAVYTIAQCAAPSVSPDGGNLIEGQSVTFDCAQDGARIFYSIEGLTNGEVAAAAGETYTFDKVGSYTVLMRATHPDYTDSETVTADFVISERPMVAPVITFSVPEGNVVGESVDVQIMVNEDVYPAADIYYTVDAKRAHITHQDDCEHHYTLGQIINICAAEGLNQVTINAHAVNAAGFHTHAATYTFGAKNEPGVSTWKIVTDASTLKDGDKIVLVSNYKYNNTNWSQIVLNTAGINGTGKSKATANVTVSDGEISSEEVAGIDNHVEFIVETVGDNYRFKTGESEYLYSIDKNGIYMGNPASDAKDNISISIDKSTNKASMRFVDGNYIYCFYYKNGNTVAPVLNSYTNSKSTTQYDNFQIYRLQEIPGETIMPPHDYYFVMEENLWDSGNEIAVPFSYNESEDIYTLDVKVIPGSGSHMSGDVEIIHDIPGFAGAFYIRDGKANNAGRYFVPIQTARSVSRVDINNESMVPFIVDKNGCAEASLGLVDNTNSPLLPGAPVYGVVSKLATMDDGIYAINSGTLKLKVDGDNSKLSIGEATVTGVSDVAVDAAEVEFFNLQGVRVTNPENGVYIRRQGSTVTKVYVR